MKSTAILIIGAIIAIIVALSAFTVQEYQYAIKFRLGEIVRVDYDPGLHWKVPFINNVRTFDKRIQALDMPPEEVNTIEQKYLDVDYFVMWKIIDPGQYYVATRGGDVEVARDRLSQIIRRFLREEFAKRTLIEVISQERGQIMDDLTNVADQRSTEFGIDVIDVRIKQIELTEQVLGSVFRRMETERLEFANELRSLGREQAERTRALADREVRVLLAEARKESEQIRGQGDARSTDIYAQAYEQDREFYSFFRSLQAYQRSFDSKDDVLVLDPESEFFDYFGSQQPASGN